MAFVSNITGTTQLDSSIVLAFDQSFIVANTQANVVDQFISYKRDIGAASIQLTRYDALGLATTPLNEMAEITSTAMSDSSIIFTPVEYGKAVSRTSLVDLQTGGKANLAAAALVGKNMGETTDALGIMAIEATTNKLVVGGGATATATDKMTGTVLNAVYNKLARANVPTFDGGLYVAFIHDDVIADIRAGAAGGDWTDVVKYATPETALRNEVGTYKGFRIVRDNHCKVDLTGSVPQYNSSFIGFNGLGKAESLVPEIRVTGPFDTLGRVVNVGWYGVFQYKIVEPAAAWTVVSASSLYPAV